jgi:protein-tyrosine phosphatase
MSSDRSEGDGRASTGGVRGVEERAVSGYIDLHCHPLPGIDDGCRTAEEGALVLAGLAKLGFRVVVATPHVRCPTWDNRPETVAPARQALETAMAALVAQGEAMPEFFTAAEHLFDDVSWERLTTNAAMMLPGGRAALVELPYDRLPMKLELRIWRLLKTHKITAVVAHPERCSALTSSEEALEQVIAAGAKLQLDVMSLTGAYGSTAREAARRWVAKGRYTLAATDAHKPSDVAKVGEAIEALRSLGGDAAVAKLFAEGPSSLVAV